MSACLYNCLCVCVCVCVCAEEGQELREGGDPHPVHELAGPRRPRRATSPAETEAACQCFQEFLQWPHRRSLQVRFISLSQSYDCCFCLFDMSR